MYSEFTNHGVTEATPKEILLGAGTIHKNLKFDAQTKKWNIKESLVGATSGGNKVSIVPEVITVEVDGALVKVMGLDFKQGESAKIETNLVEITPELLKTTVIGEIVDSGVEGYNLIESKANIEAGDYFGNVAFVGKKTNGTPIIIILDNALCTSGFEGEGKNKDKTVVKVTFECTQKIGADLSKLPYHIYYPTPVDAPEQASVEGEDAEG
jgi:hypothetical protein